MSYDSLEAYHRRREAEAHLALERLRRRDSCDQPHMGPVTTALATVGTVVVAGVVLNWLFGDN